VCAHKISVKEYRSRSVVVLTPSLGFTLTPTTLSVEEYVTRLIVFNLAPTSDKNLATMKPLLATSQYDPPY